MKVCPNCQSKYPDDANFCPQEACATREGPRRLEPVAARAALPRASSWRSQLGGSRSGEVWRARDTQTGGTVAYKLVAQASLPTTATFERAQRELKQLQRAQSNRASRACSTSARSRRAACSSPASSSTGQTLDRLVAAPGRCRSIAPRRSSRRSARRCWKGQKVGVVHHDLSPKNVLVVGERRRSRSSTSSRLSPVSETVFGVPEYLSPEQAEGKLVDQRSNTYSLGGMLTADADRAAARVGRRRRARSWSRYEGEIIPPSRRRRRPDARDRSRRPQGDGQEPEPAPADHAAVPHRGQRDGRAGRRRRRRQRAASGFAKTMMFAGGSPEVQKLVQAGGRRPRRRGNRRRGCARTDTGAAAAPRLPRRGRRQPPRTRRAPAGPRRTHGAAIAATMVALPGGEAPLRAARPSARCRPRQPEPSGQIDAAARGGDATAAGDRGRAGVGGRRRRRSRRRAETSARRSGSRRATSIRWSPRRAPASRRRAPRASRCRTPEAAVARGRGAAEEAPAARRALRRRRLVDRRGPQEVLAALRRARRRRCRRWAVPFPASA